MQTTGLKSFAARIPRTNFVLSKLATDERKGAGAATLNRKTLAVADALEPLERHLVRGDPSRSDAFAEQIHREPNRQTEALRRISVGAADPAMLDIKGSVVTRAVVMNQRQH